MTAVWFMSPAWQRFELSAVCFEQRRRSMDVLEAAGIEARCVIVADDENLDIARGLGFDVVEQDNEWLGRKVNDGFEYAFKHGADYIVPIGSDSWLDPEFLLPLHSPRVVRTSRFYAPVEIDRLAELSVTGMNGAGPHVWPRRYLERSGFRPIVAQQINRNLDSSTIRGIASRTPITWEWRDLYPLQYVGFRVHPFITAWASLWRRWGIVERPDPWTLLAERYPQDLVDRARAILVQQAEAAA